MLKKSVLLVFALVVSFSLALPVCAFEAKVVKVDGKIVTLTSAEALPAWVKKGALAKTSNGLAKVKAVDGRQFNVQVRKSTAAKLKAGDVLEVTPKNKGGGHQLQGC